MTTKPLKPAKLTKAQLKAKVIELEAQLVHTSFFAGAEIKKCTRTRYGGSAIIVTLHGIGGKPICMPFAIKDGFSDETIKALLSDLQYTYDRAIEFTPVKP